jgi:hypothetical protein
VGDHPGKSPRRGTAQIVAPGPERLESAAAQWPCLSVMSATVGDAVQFAGGLIYDRVKVGWRVTVLLLLPLAEDEDTRALRILGADVTDIADPPTQLRERPTALAASTEMFTHHATTRSELKAAMATNTTEVILWGSDFPADLEHGSRKITYRPSRAALVFKGHALVAAGLDPASIEQAETFGTTCSRNVIARDLDVAG